MSVLIAVFLLGLAFYLLTVLTEEFFVPSIDKISKKLKLSSDASGATLLAMGSSAPEFFTSLFAVLGLAGSAHADIGAGTIVGSAIFNVLVIVGAAAMFKAVTLQWKPVIRDLIFYIVTIVMLMWAFWDGKIEMYEALVFIFTYVVYVFVTVNWSKWLKYDEPPEPKHEIKANRNRLNAASHRFLSFFIPDPNKKPRLYLWTFLLAIAAIAGLSWMLIGQIMVIADVLSINPVFLALTVLAAGTSVPDLVGSIIVAKQGRGDMAVSNAIGSNIFDILFALGLPWAIALTINPGSISVGTENLLASVFLLFATVVATLFLLILRKWRLGPKSGLLLIGLYIVYAVYIAIAVA